MSTERSSGAVGLTVFASFVLIVIGVFQFLAGITALARNEWICWVTSAKKEETRAKRIKWGCENLSAGKRRPCCWAGCPHR